MEEVPRRTSLAPLAFPCSVLCLVGVSIERWKLHPVMFGVDDFLRITLTIAFFNPYLNWFSRVVTVPSEDL